MKMIHCTVIALLFIGCDKDDTILGSGKIIQQDRSVSSFTKVNSTSSINIEVTHGSTQSVEVSADDNVINNVKTVVENGILQVKLAKGSYNDVTINISIVLPELVRLENTGSGNMSITDFIDLDNLEIENEGSGTITANGSVNSLLISNSGSGSYKGFNFSVKDCSVANSGSGNCEITCSANLSGTNSGSGTVYYKGAASVDITNTGSGEVVNSN